MLTGTELQRVEQEKQEMFAFERRMQPKMDVWYEGRGHEILTRDGNKEYDLILRVGDKQQKTEEKFRNGLYDDLLIETLQDYVTGDLGWRYHTRCEYLHYVMCEGEKPNEQPKRLYRVQWPPFKAWLDSWLADNYHQRVIFSKRGYGLTENLVVPIWKIPKRLFQVELLGGAS